MFLKLGLPECDAKVSEAGPLHGQQDKTIKQVSKYAKVVDGHLS
jgi:hypothetical protein